MAEVKYSVCGTIYNNVDRVRRCLNSLLAALSGLDFEMVIVDNYSTDGSYEILEDYARRYGNIKVLRRKCSRGLGRQLAYLNSRGQYIIPIDTDTEYDSEKLHQLVMAYKQNPLMDVKCVKTMGNIGVYPRRIVKEVGGWRDYNLGEDFDFLARLCMTNRLVFLPVSLDWNEPCGKPVSKGDLRAEVGVAGRERRYARGPRGLLRALRNKIDFYSAWGYTLRKLILRHRDIGIEPHIIFLAVILLLFSKLVNFILKKTITYADPDLHNAHYIYYKQLENTVNPRLFGFQKEDIDQIAWDKDLTFIAKFHPEVIQAKNITKKVDP